MFKGKSLVAGHWIGSGNTFTNEPTSAVEPDAFFMGTTELVDQACEAAEDAFWSYGYSDVSVHSNLLRQIANQMEARREMITTVGNRETGLPEARLEGECARTVSQLRFFADYIDDGAHLDMRHEPAEPNRSPVPKPDLRLLQRPMGPVAIFGASNFPLAFSTAGGDTASALAAGCPVVVKGHPAHPGLSDLIAQAFHAAIKETGVHPGVFNHILDGGHSVGESLVKHPLIRAVGFTGSLRGGRALYDLCVARPEPIPFFGELGSTNPMFVLPAALETKGTEIAQGWATSLSMGAGQFCTNPGIAVVLEGPDAQDFCSKTATALSAVSEQTMLTTDITAAFQKGCDTFIGAKNVQTLLTPDIGRRSTTPGLVTMSAKDWIVQEDLQTEVFGPFGIIIRAADMDEMISLAKSLQGQLTCSMHFSDNDTDDARNLLPVLERKAGRILANGFPTGVEVCSAMVHSGPYPASTNFGATSVGSMAIRRFLRPICYQDIPQELLPINVTAVPLVS